MTDRPVASNVQPAEPGDATGDRALGRDVGVGLSWSLLNNVVGRLGNFLTGIIVIRHIAHEEYGVFAVGLVVLTVLLSMNELGVSVAVVQHRGRVQEIAPTVMSLSILSSAALSVAGFFAAPAAAAAMGSPEAAGLIRLLLVGVALDGIASVPNALLTRLFRQRTRLLIDLAAFLIGTPVTIGLALTGHGAWSLGWGAVVGNAVAAVLALALSPVRVWPGWDPSVVPGLLRFGLPLAGASLLSLSILNVDFVVVGHVLGPEELGLYLLAFNLCSWPITVVTSAIRRVAIALFARLAEHADDGGRQAFGRVFALVLALAAPMCLLLAGYGTPLVTALYGERWAPAAVVLAPLAVFSLGRVAVEVTYDFFAGSGRTVSTVWLHVVWLAALVPALTVGARLDGIEGVAIGHAVVTAVVVGSALVVLLRRSGIHGRDIARRLLVVGVGVLAMWAVVLVTQHLPLSPLAAMLVGSPLALGAYLVCLRPLRADVLDLWELRSAQDPADSVGDGRPEAVSEEGLLEDLREAP